MLAKFSDDKRTLDWYRVRIDGVQLSTGTDDYSIEKIYHTDSFYAFPPYPVPAKETVKTLVLWNSFNLNFAIEGVFNIYGERIAESTEINIISKSTNSAILEWDCSSVDDGVYFIIISHNGVYENIPFVKMK